MAATVTVKFHPGWEKHLDVSPVLNDLGPPITDMAKRLAPVDTGQLRDSIDWEVRTDPDAILYIYATAPHAPYVELGTSRMRAQPYLRPAVMRRWT